MTEFLDLKSPQDFWELLINNAHINPAKTEKVDFVNSLHRCLARDVSAPENLPPFSRSTVDGFAVRAQDTAGASASLPVYLDVIGEVDMGESTELQVAPGEAVSIPTGGMLPVGADAALMIEYTDYLDQNTIETSYAVAAGENVVEAGEDIEKGELLLEKGHRIRPQDIGALAGLGMTEVEVFVKPKVTIISTGDELITPYEDAGAGEIRDINTYSLAALLAESGARVKRQGIVEDSFAELKKSVKESLDHDLILISGGSSVGIKDMTIDVLNSLGEPGVLLHGVSIKPGKPTILAVIDNTPVIGLPGHPASAWTITANLIQPLVLNLGGERILDWKQIKENQSAVIRKQNRIQANKIKARLTRNLDSDRGREEYIPVKLERLFGQKGEKDEKDRYEDLKKKSHGEADKNIYNIEYRAVPITGKSSLITTLVEADGFILIDTYKEGLNEGQIVEVQLF